MPSATESRKSNTSLQSAHPDHPASIFDLLERAGRNRRDDIAVVIGEGLERATYGELLDRAERFAADLLAMGVSPGARVLLWMRNSIDMVVALMATARVQGVAAPVNTRWTVAELQPLVTYIEPVVVVLEQDLLTDGATLSTAFGQSDGRTVVVGRGDSGRVDPTTLVSHVTPGHLGQATTAPSAPSASLTPPPRRRRSAECDAGVAVILATSGTTSLPKAVMLEHVGLTRLAIAIAARQDLGPSDRLYTVAPLYHCSGFVHGLLTSLASGARLYLTARYRPSETARVLRIEQITSYHGFSLPLREAAHVDIPGSVALRAAWFSAPADEMAELEAQYGVPMCELYGLTETGGNSVMTRLTDPVSVRHNTDGYPHDGIEVGVFDADTGEHLPDGIVGEIRVRGWNLMRGYYRDPEATAAAIDEMGWLRTGDAGTTDEQGHLTFLSRRDDIVRVGGENVDPVEVERVLESHPDVVEAAAVGVPHERLGQVLVAFVVLRQGREEAAEALPDHCRRRLAEFKVPRRAIVVDHLPRTAATGRLQRSLLRMSFESLDATLPDQAPTLSLDIPQTEGIDP